MKCMNLMYIINFKVFDLVTPTHSGEKCKLYSMSVFILIYLPVVAELFANFRIFCFKKSLKLKIIIQLNSYPGPMLPPEASLLNKSSCLGPTLGVTKFIIVKDVIFVLHKSDLDVQQTHLWVLYHETFLGSHLIQFANDSPFPTWGQCYKTFFLCNLRIFIVS